MLVTATLTAKTRLGQDVSYSDEFNPLNFALDRVLDNLASIHCDEMIYGDERGLGFLDWKTATLTVTGFKKEMVD